ncbi:mitochondrial 2-oxoglutarate/malate carrier protein-like isoform X2 [Corticium candelabrum]|uniref:mitochondrial 2-oxoglutarate/malate carrier protein-like isoform X2 n=1 Tax=Corticium candelabrum TaxID=121492 RepID=UPI002E256A66|nr:mitochondrial 2-oxoglutarate/malate carrier protein-like isoform X2 [Corticium candelabrum]
MTSTKLPLPTGIKFVFGGTAGMSATMFVHPFDLVKSRMQLSGEGGAVKKNKTSFHALARVLRNEGFLGLYTGLTAGLFRQATYATTRLGVYTTLFDMMQSPDGQPPSFTTKILCGITAGAFGAVVGTPAEISLIRMTVDGSLPLEQRRGYKNVFNALYRICVEEGVFTMWRGCGPTVFRAMVVNAAQLATYSQSKQLLLSTGFFKDGISCHFCASMISGFVTALSSMPLDIAKTRIQNMRHVDGIPQYRGVLDVWVKTAHQEGFRSLWKGFSPYYLRIGPHTVLSFIVLEQLKKLYYVL